MYSGDRELSWSRPCWLINFWSGKFDDKIPSKDYREDMGVFDFSNVCVKRMHEAIPLLYDEGLIPKDDTLRYGEEEMRSAWDDARDFLSYAASCGKGICGSY